MAILVKLLLLSTSLVLLTTAEEYYLEDYLYDNYYDHDYDFSGPNPGELNFDRINVLVSVFFFINLIENQVIF